MARSDASSRLIAPCASLYSLESTPTQEASLRSRLLIHWSSAIREVNLPSTRGHFESSSLHTSHSLSISGLSIDNQDNIYVSDSFNFVIRKIFPNSTAITITIVALESSGNMFIADSENHLIRKIDQFGIITTFAGSTTKLCSADGLGAEATNSCNGSYSGDGGPAIDAALHTPKGIKLDPTERSLLICDSGNHAIRKIDLITGIITTIAGNGTSGFSGDGGKAKNAQLHLPRGIALSPSGDLFVADSFNHVIRKISARDQIISTVAGVPTQPGGSGNGGPAVVSQRANHQHCCAARQHQKTQASNITFD